MPDLGHQIGQYRSFLHPSVIVESESSDGIVALNKPQGVLSHPNIDNQASNKAILTCPYSLKNELYHFNNLPIAYLLNRLDSPVSGLISIALNEEAALSAKQAFQEKTIKKKYLALVKGHLPHLRGTWRSYLSKIKEYNVVRASNFGNIAAITEYQVIKEFSWKSITLSLVSLQPITGRTHQLRIHCAQNFVPIVGDKVYGDFKFNKKFAEQTNQKQLFLHSDELFINYLLNNQRRTFFAKSSHDFRKFCINILNS